MGETKVDYYCVKVLKGERLFYLLVYAFLCTDRMSLRKLEAVFASPQFKTKNYDNLYVFDRDGSREQL